MKPGSQPYGGRERTGKIRQSWDEAIAEGQARRNAMLDYLAGEIAAGRVGAIVGSPHGLIGSMVPPVTVSDDGALVKFQLSPHLHLSEEKQLEQTGDRQWQISF